jgi:electron transport complex protein RnfE
MNDYRKIFREGFWLNNTGLIVLFGLCPLLAVSTTLAAAFALGIATAVTLFFSSLVVSLVRAMLGPEIRIAVYVLIIATVVSAVQLLMQAWLFELYHLLGIFVPLIVANCAIIGRAETFASRNSPLPSMIDAVATGLGFCLVLSLMGALRELLGQGTLFSQAGLIFGTEGDSLLLSITPDHSGFLFALLPPGAFMCLGFLIAGRNWLDSRSKQRALILGKVHETSDSN